MRGFFGQATQVNATNIDKGQLEILELSDDLIGCPERGVHVHPPLC